MATLLTADAMLAALAKWGIAPKFFSSDWRTHNRDAVQGWGPLYGLDVHNFGSDNPDGGELQYLYDGDLARNMPGPLSQFAITDDGSLWVIGWGTANHTGSIGAPLLALVQNDQAPLDHDVAPTTTFSNQTGVLAINKNFLGVEMTYGAAPTAAQRATLVRLGAALMDALGPGYTGGSVVGHRECDSQRSDPVGVSMFQLRRDINALLKAGPSSRTATASTVTPAPTPTPIAQEDDMPRIISATGRPAWALTDGVTATMLPVGINPSEYAKLGVPSTQATSVDPKLYDTLVAAGNASQTAALAGQIAGLTAALQQVQSGESVDVAAITAAAKAGAQSALDEKISSAAVSLNVAPTAGA